MKSEMDKKKIEQHPFPPLFDKDSKVLILGSFPSVKSREMMCFYGHPQNRFWKVIASIKNAKANAAWSLERLIDVWGSGIKN